MVLVVSRPLCILLHWFQINLIEPVNVGTMVEILRLRLQSFRPHLLLLWGQGLEQRRGLLRVLIKVLVVERFLLHPRLQVIG